MKLDALRGHEQIHEKSCAAACTMGILHLTKGGAFDDKTEQMVWDEIKFGTEAIGGVDPIESSPLKVVQKLGTGGLGAKIVLDSVTYAHSMGLHSQLREAGANFLAVIGSLPSRLQPDVFQRWENSINLATNKFFMLNVIIIDWNNQNMPTEGTHMILASPQGAEVQIYDSANGGYIKTWSNEDFKALLQGLSHFDIGQRYVFSGLAIVVDPGS